MKKATAVAFYYNKILLLSRSHFLYQSNFQGPHQQFDKGLFQYKPSHHKVFDKCFELLLYILGNNSNMIH